MRVGILLVASPASSASGAGLVIKNMNIHQALSIAIKSLQRKNINSASLDTEILLAFVLNKPKEFLYTHPEFKLTKTRLTKFEKLLAQRLKHVPVAYLIGYKEFYGLKFKVSKAVLVPRPLSEGIVDKTLDIIKKQLLTRDTRTAIELSSTICDIGTGSGCLIIALAKKLIELKMIDSCKLFATDISAKALKVAKSNAKLHKVDKYIIFLKGDLLEPVIKKLAPNAKGGGVDLIMANLPYLTKADYKKEKSIQSEPISALVSKNKGRFHYQQLFKQIKTLLINKPIIIYENIQGIHIKNQPL
jgi:release factor glutamine methyltransferase